MPSIRCLAARTRQTLARLHRDEKGAEGLEKLFIVAAIVLPLIAILIIFRDELTEWVSERWDEVKTSGGG